MATAPPKIQPSGHPKHRPKAQVTSGSNPRYLEDFRQIMDSKGVDVDLSPDGQRVICIDRETGEKKELPIEVVKE